MAFVSVAVQMAVQAAILAAAGKNKDEIGKATAKTAISGAVGGAVGGALGSSSTGGAMASEGIGGALGGMAANAAYGENIGQGALMGGIAGAARGYAKGPDIGSNALIDPNMSGRDLFPQGANTGNVAVSNFTESLPMGFTGKPTDYAGAWDRYKPGIGEGETLLPDFSIGANNPHIVGPDLANSEAGTQFASQFAKNNAVVDPGKPSILSPTPETQSTGDFIKDNYGKLATAGLLGAGGAFLLGSNGGSTALAPTSQPESIYDPDEPDTTEIPRTRVPRYYNYAEGGLTGVDGATQNAPEELKPMNPFVQMGIDQAQQAQQAQPQVQPQVQPQAGIPMPPQMQPQQNFASGGLTDGMPNSGLLKSLYGATIGGAVAPGIGNALFGKNDNAHNSFLKQVNNETKKLTAQGVEPVTPVTPVTPVAPIAPVEPIQRAAAGGIMQDNLGGYSHGGIAGLTRGPGDGVSDSIPAEIGNSGKQPARLADGEFVIPSRIVSELGNGSTEAGAKALQAMVDRVQKRRSKTTGKGKVAVNSRARKELV